MGHDTSHEIEDEYSYPPEGKGRAVDLSGFGIQGPMPSKGRQPTKRVYTYKLTDADIARIKAKTAQKAAEALKGGKP